MAEALHDPILSFVIFNLSYKIKDAFCLFRVCNILFCLGNRDYPQWKEGNIADVIDYGVPLVLLGIGDNYTFLPNRAISSLLSVLGGSPRSTYLTCCLGLGLKV